MDAFSYVTAFTSIILALGVTRLVAGLGKLLEERSQIRVYWVHLLWVANVFLFLCLQWWVLFRWQAQEQWSFYLFLFLLANPTIVFLLTVILFPDKLTEKDDLKQHFYNHNRWFFALAAFLPFLDFIDTTLKGFEHLLAQGLIYFVTIPLISVLCIIGAATDNEKYHKFFSIFFMVYIMVFISINLASLA
jgi:hypothetical protein